MAAFVLHRYCPAELVGLNLMCQHELAGEVRTRFLMAVEVFDSELT